MLCNLLQFFLAGHSRRGRRVRERVGALSDVTCEDLEELFPSVDKPS